MLRQKIGNTKEKFGAAQLAELKLLTVLIYFICLTVMALTIDSYTTSVTPNRYLQALLPYFACESTGSNSSRDCQNLLFDVQQQSVFNLSVSLVLLVGFLPVVIFLFSTDFKLIIHHAKYISKKCGCSGHTTK